MILNPELRRNLWLEFTPQRLIVTPIIIAALLYLSYLTSTGGLYNVKTAAFYIAVFYIFLWGTKAASESIPDEVNNHTWDIQRLSVIKPSTLAWGKLFGSTAYAWYGAGLALIPYVIISLQTVSFENLYVFLLQLLVILLGGLFAHSLALFSSMSALQQTEKSIKIKTYRYFLFGLLTAWLTIPSLYDSLPSVLKTITWYHFTFSAFWFGFTSLCLFLGWSLIGIIRSMRQALQYQSQPWVWFVFSVFCIVYFSGFINFDSWMPTADKLSQSPVMQQVSHAPKMVAFSVASILLYFSLFFEKINTVIYKKLWNKRQFPRWSISFILVLMIGIWICFTSNSEYFIPSIFAISSVLLIMRDILIVHYFQFADNPKRALLTAAFYLGVLYILIPSILSSLGLKALLAVFLPGGVGEYKMISLIGPGLQVALIGWMVSFRMRAQLK